MKDQIRVLFAQLAQTQEEFHVTQMLQTMILQAANTNLRIRLEQQGYLDHLMHILTPAQQGLIPNQVHQQIQHLLAPYHREGVDIYPADPPITVSEATQYGMIQLNVQLLTAVPKQWTMYRIYTMPRQRGAQAYRVKTPFEYILIHHQLCEYIPLEEREAQDCLSRTCRPTAPRRRARTGPCAIKRLLNREIDTEECTYVRSERKDKLVSTQHGLAYAVHQTTTANIHCLQTDHQPEVMRSITLNDWGTIDTTPGCYIETETQRTHSLPYNVTPKHFNYQQTERFRTPIVGYIEEDDPIMQYLDLVFAVISFIISGIFASLMLYECLRRRGRQKAPDVSARHSPSDPDEQTELNILKTRRQPRESTVYFADSKTQHLSQQQQEWQKQLQALQPKTMP